MDTPSPSALVNATPSSPMILEAFRDLAKDGIRKGWSCEYTMKQLKPISPGFRNVIFYNLFPIEFTVAECEIAVEKAKAHFAAAKGKTHVEVNVEDE